MSDTLTKDSLDRSAELEREANKFLTHLFDDMKFSPTDILLTVAHVVAQADACFTSDGSTVEYVHKFATALAKLYARPKVPYNSVETQAILANLKNSLKEK